MNEDIYLPASCDISECEGNWYLIGVLTADTRNHIQICFGFTWVSWYLDNLYDTVIVYGYKMTHRMLAVSMSHIRVNLIPSWIAIMKAIHCPLPCGIDSGEEI